MLLFAIPNYKRNPFNSVESMYSLNAKPRPENERKFYYVHFEN